MNREDIIRMARKAGMERVIDVHKDGTRTIELPHPDLLERFAVFVISHHVKETRPEVSDSMEKWLQQIAYQHGGIGDLSRTEMEFGAMVAAAEREACAKECDDVCANFYALYKGRPPYTGKENGRGDPIADGASHGAEKCAAAIRARGDE